MKNLVYTLRELQKIYGTNGGQKRNHNTKENTMNTMSTMESAIYTMEEALEVCEMLASEEYGRHRVVGLVGPRSAGSNPWWHGTYAGWTQAGRCLRLYNKQIGFNGVHALEVLLWVGDSLGWAEFGWLHYIADKKLRTVNKNWEEAQGMGLRSLCVNDYPLHGGVLQTDASLEWDVDHGPYEEESGELPWSMPWDWYGRGPERGTIFSCYEKGSFGERYRNFMVKEVKAEHKSSNQEKVTYDLRVVPVLVHDRAFWACNALRPEDVAVCGLPRNITLTVTREG